MSMDVHQILIKTDFHNNRVGFLIHSQISNIVWHWGYLFFPEIPTITY
jgi:hypothetical protein